MAHDSSAVRPLVGCRTLACYICTLLQAHVTQLILHRPTSSLTHTLTHSLAHSQRPLFCIMNYKKQCVHTSILTVLVFRNHHENWGCNASDMSEEDADADWNVSCIQVQHLASLADLRLSVLALSAADLTSATQITMLKLESCTLLPGQGSHTAGISALLSAVAGLQQLHHLELIELHLSFADDLLLQRFAALTGSAHLTYLEISEEEGFKPLPDGAVRHMFPHGRRLQLRQLLLLPSRGAHGPPPPYDDSSACMTGAELRRVASSCSELQQLSIAGAVYPGDMSGLLQLPASCTELCIGGRAMSNAVVPVVRQLTQLHELQWFDSPGLTDVGVEQLTALTGLRVLDVRQCNGLSEDLGGSAEYSDLQLSSGDETEVSNCWHCICQRDRR